MHPTTDDSSTAPSPDRWTAIAHGRRMPIPTDRLERIKPILDALEAKTRSALDRDLSLVEPAPIFTPGRRSR